MNDRLQGWLIGLGLPPITFILAIWAMSIRYEIPLTQVLNFAWQNGLLAPLLALTILPNLVVFLRSIHYRIERARAILMATILWGVLIVIIKYAF